MTTKKARSRRTDELRPEYELSKLAHPVRGKYYRRARGASNIVLLEPDIARAFPNGRAVNAALRSLLNNGHARSNTPRRARRKSA